MNATLSIPCSRKVYELLGDTYTTEQEHSELEEVDCTCGEHVEPGYVVTPLPNFYETIRLLRKVGEKAGLDGYGKESIGTVSEKCMLLFQEAPSEEEGMAKVSEYLERLI